MAKDRPEQMSSDDALEFYRKAKLVAVRMGFKESAEDLAQSVVLSFLKNRKSKQSIEQAVIDAIRIQFGRRYSLKSKRAVSNGKLRMNLLHAMELDVSKSKKTAPPTQELLGFQGVISGLQKRDRVLIVLYVMYDLTFAEIGFVVGESGANIGSRVADILERLKKEYE